MFWEIGELELMLETLEFAVRDVDFVGDDGRLHCECCLGFACSWADEERKTRTERGGEGREGMLRQEPGEVEVQDRGVGSTS